MLTKFRNAIKLIISAAVFIGGEIIEHVAPRLVPWLLPHKQLPPPPEKQEDCNPLTDPDCDRKIIRVRHYSFNIGGIKRDMAIGPGTFEVYFEFPLSNTPRRSPDLENTYKIFRPGKRLNGIVEFNVDLSKWDVSIDTSFVELGTAWKISLYPNGRNGTFPFETGFLLTAPGVNPEFFDKSGNLI